MNGLPSSLSAFLRRKDSAYAQFVKYVFCGGISVLVDQVVFYLLAWLLFPALRLSDPVAKLIQWAGFTIQEVSEQQLKTNYWIIKVNCFVFSNAVVYILNVLFVFRSGRHRRSVEVLLFFGTSLLQFFFIWMGSVLFKDFGWEVTYANLTMLVLSIITNYVVRKRYVFKG